MAHTRPAQVARLVARLEAPGDQIYVHVDAQVPQEPFTQALAPYPSVEWTARHRCRRTSYGLMAATLDGMRAALAGGADYISVISGQDYPIKPVEELRSHLNGRAGTCFMNFWELPNPRWEVPDGGLWRVEVRHYQLGRRRFRIPNRFTPFIPRRRVPLGLTPYAGADWWTLPRAAVQHIVDFVERHPEVVRFYRHTLAPSEGLPHTILLNSPLRDRVVYGNLRHIVFPEGAWHPLTLGVFDFEALRNSGAFVARKFDAERDPQVLDLIDEHLLGLDPGAR
jgi:hypothetical protein